MKRIFSIIALFLGLLMILDSCASGRRKDVVISYEQLSADASFKQFKKATKTNQIENLTALVRRANEDYLKCQTIEDLYTVKEQLDLIKFYNDNADQKSITVTNEIRKLEHAITQTEAEFKGQKVIEGSRSYYSDHGQETD